MTFIYEHTLSYITPPLFVIVYLLLSHPVLALRCTGQSQTIIISYPPMSGPYAMMAYP